MSERRLGRSSVVDKQAAFFAAVSSLGPGTQNRLFVAPGTAFPAATAVGPARQNRRLRRSYELVGDRAQAARWSARRLGSACAAAPDYVVTAAVVAALARYAAVAEVVVGLVAPGGRWSLSVRVDAGRSIRHLVDQVSAALAQPPACDGGHSSIVIWLPGTDDLMPMPTASRPDCDLLLEISRGGDHLTAEFDFDRHGGREVDSFLEYAETLLRKAAEAPEDNLRDLVTSKHRPVTGSKRVDSPDSTITGCFETVAERYANRVAVADQAGSLTYRELGRAARAVMREIESLPVEVEDRMAVLISRGDRRLVVACLGVLYAAGIWLPLDPDTPAERLVALLRQANAKIVVTDRALAERVPDGPWHLLDLDSVVDRAADDAAHTERESDRRPGVGQVSARQAAYCIFTSGSTGRPKGVVIEHASAVNFAYAYGRQFELTPDDRVLQYASPAFDVIVQEIFATLFAGASLWVTDDESRLSIEALSQVLERENITVAELPPVVLEMMDPARFPRLRAVSVGGEPFAGSLVTRWSAGHRVINGYGPTETTVGVIYKDFSGELRSAPPIGRPVGGHRAYLLDADLRPVPFGAVGELYIGGPGLARGYLGDAAETASRFVPDPFSTVGERLFRTGDLARLNAAGDLVFVGRQDRQVKINGQRIELGEIEAAMTALPEVTAAVTDLHSGLDDAGAGTGSEAVLTGYLVTHENGIDLSSVRRRLTDRLPAAMVPRRLVTVPGIPLTTHSKIDFAALRRYGATTPWTTDPLTESQRQVFERCVARVMPEARAMPDLNFFEMGCSSLQVMRLLAAIHQAYGVEVSVVEFLRRPTLSVLADLVDRSLPEPEAPVRRDPRTVPQPLAAGQRALWLMDQMVADRSCYNIIEAFRLRGRLDPDALGRAVTAIVERHEALRTRVLVADGVPLQSVDPVGAFDLDLVELPDDTTDGTGGGEAERIRELLSRLRSSPFDLGTEHPFRVSLIRIGPKDHVLAMVMHHIASDGRSTEVLLEELSGLYAAGGSAPLPSLPFQPVDFAVWQRERLTPDLRDSELAYWREKLSALPAERELPADRPRPAASSNRGATLHVELPQEIVAQADAMGRAIGATPFMTFLAVFAATLARYSRSRDVVVGTPMSSRGRAEFDGLVGFLCNMIALRIDCTGDPTFRELMGRVKETTATAYGHQNVPFEQVVAAVCPERDAARNPLFQVTFQLYDAPEDFLVLPGVEVEKAAVPDSTSRFDLSMAVQVSKNGRTVASLAYDLDLFDPTTAGCISDHFRTMLESCVTTPDKRLSQLALMDAAETEALIASSIGPRVPLGGTVPELFDAQAAATPDQTAVIADARRLTYADLRAESNRLAHLLIARGVRPGSVVGVCQDRRPDLPVTLLAILKTGAAYLPIAPATPTARTEFMFADADAHIAVTERRLVDRLPAAVPALLIDDLPAEHGEMPSSDPAIAVHAEDVAYVTYTSGSTGRPKGVAVPHRAVVRLVRGLPPRTVQPDDVFLLLAPTAFDASVFEMWTPLTHGARLAIYPPGPVGPYELGEALRGMNVTVLWLTAQFTNLVVNADPRQLAPLRLLVTGGEALSPSHIHHLRAALPDLTVLNGYGPTETATFAAMHPAEPDADAESVPIGRPIGGTELYVLDPELNLVPQGVVGELYIGGSGLARGYLNRPGLTAERFIAHPFGDSGERLYRTGDLVRRLPGGELEFIGRVDDQVKLRGFRIEPGEVAVACMRHPTVRNAFVTTWGEGINTQLVAYVETRDGYAEEKVRDHLRRYLPGYMVPSAFVEMNDLPLTRVGKVDRGALPEPRPVRRAGKRGPATVGSGTERLVAEAWAEVLGHRDFAVDDDFFRIGGNSLQAMRLAGRLSSRSGAVSLATVFRSPTVAAQAALLDKASPAGGRDETAGSQGEGRPAPLAPGQQALWFLEQLYPGRPAYNVPFTVRLRGDLDREALRSALRSVVERHEVLRERFVLGNDGRPVQIVESVDLVPFLIEDLDEAAAMERLRQDAQQPFDLATGPLLRAHLARVGPDAHLLSVTAHHAVFDGWSLEVFLSDLAAFYRVHRDGHGAAGVPPPLEASYREFAAAQRVLRDGSELDADLGYWRRRLAGLQPLDLPADRPRPPRRSGRGGCRRSRLLVGTDRLEEVARASGTTTTVILTAAFAAWLAEVTDRGDIAFGFPVSGRDQPETRRLIGHFVNTLVLRIDLTMVSGFTAVCDATRKAMTGALAHQAVPFERLVTELNPRRDAARTPLFQTVLSVQDEELRRLDLPGIEAEWVETHNGTAKFDLDVAVTIGPPGVDCTIEYDTDLFNDATIAGFADGYHRVLERALAELATG